MVKKTRMKKGIESLKEQIREHEKKRDEAKARGDAGAVRYFDREIAAFKKEINKRQLKSLSRKERLKVKRKDEN